ncbi:MAG: hypothetical protein IJ568_06275 [Bacilli bacterium]|nr:hypothetical protein [Bacilli bacterium]
MKILNKKRKLIFEFETDENGIMVTTRVKGKLTLNDILCAKQVIDNKVNDNGKNKRK